MGEWAAQLKILAHMSASGGRKGGECPAFIEFSTDDVIYCNFTKVCYDANLIENFKTVRTVFIMLSNICNKKIIHKYFYTFSAQDMTICCVDGNIIVSAYM